MKHTQQNEKRSRSFAVSINNTTPNQQSVDVFKITQVGVSKKYGNADGVIITNMFEGETYDELLEELRGKIITVGTTSLQFISGNNRSICMPFCVHTEQGENYHGMRIVPMLDPYQQWSDIVNVIRNYEFNNLNGYSFLKMTIPANTCINVLLHLSKEEFYIADAEAEAPNFGVKK